MARIISFSMTERQFLDGSKDVTRRMGWRNLRPGDELKAVRKTMGLKKGEHQVVLGRIRVLDAYRERLNWVTKVDCRREGFPEMSADEFVAMFCHAMRCKPNAWVTRIEFRRI